ncbi:aldo/keto reductase [Streptomyces collinus]
MAARRRDARRGAAADQDRTDLTARIGPPEAEVFPLSAANGISQIVWSPLAQGVLTGKYKPGRPAPQGSRFASDTMAVSKDLVYSGATLEAVQRLAPIAEEAGMSLPTLALAWVLRRGEVASAITGASRPEQVHANAAASGVELSDDLLTAVDQALGDAPVTGPVLAPGADAGIKHR